MHPGPGQADTNYRKRRERVRERGIETLSEEITIETFPNLVKKRDIQVHEEQSPKQDEPTEAYT